MNTILSRHSPHSQQVSSKIQSIRSGNTIMLFENECPEAPRQFVPLNLVPRRQRRRRRNVFTRRRARGNGKKRETEGNAPVDPTNGRSTTSYTFRDDAAEPRGSHGVFPEIDRDSRFLRKRLSSTLVVLAAVLSTVNLSLTRVAIVRFLSRSQKREERKVSLQPRRRGKRRRKLDRQILSRSILQATHVPCREASSHRNEWRDRDSRDDFTSLRIYRR